MLHYVGVHFALGSTVVNCTEVAIWACWLDTVKRSCVYSLHFVCDPAALSFSSWSSLQWFLVPNRFDDCVVWNSTDTWEKIVEYVQKLGMHSILQSWCWSPCPLVFIWQPLWWCCSSARCLDCTISLIFSEWHFSYFSTKQMFWRKLAELIDGEFRDTLTPKQTENKWRAWNGATKTTNLQQIYRVWKFDLWFWEVSFFVVIILLDFSWGKNCFMVIPSYRELSGVLVKEHHIRPQITLAPGRRCLWAATLSEFPQW